MKVTKTNKIKEMHTNRLLISAGVALSLIVALMIVHRGQYTNPLLTMNSTLVFSILLGIGAVAVGVISYIKKKCFLAEYAGLLLVMAFCFYCVHGVGFVNAKLMKYVTAAVIGAYFVLSFAYHTAAPYFMKKK